MTPTQEEIGAILGLLQMALTTPRNIADVNINLAAHCDTVNVRVFPGGWKPDQKPICDLTAFIGSEQSPMLILRETAAMLGLLSVQHVAAQMLNAAGTPQTEMEAE